MRNNENAPLPGIISTSIFDLPIKADMTPLPWQGKPFGFVITEPETYEDIRYEGIFPHLKPVLRRFLK